MSMKPRSASGSKPRINLINPHTGHFSPKPEDEEEEFFNGISAGSDDDEDSRFHELKPDPLTLFGIGPHHHHHPHQQGGGPISPLSEGDLGGQEQQGENQISDPRRRGGRLRDPVWSSFINIGDKMWQCKDCPYSLIRPQADRMRKHRTKCQLLGGASRNNTSTNNASGGGGVQNIPAVIASVEGASSSGQSSSATTVMAAAAATIPGMTQFKTNSITQQLKRIADSLEEANKLKKLKLGLDPHLPFDGGSSSKSSSSSSARK